MKIACYIGSHKKDRFSVCLGWMLVRFVQRGRFSHVTHVEAVLAEHEDGTFDIGSASLRDGGVRVKYRTFLAPENWLIFDVCATFGDLFFPMKQTKFSRGNIWATD